MFNYQDVKSNAILVSTLVSAGVFHSSLLAAGNDEISVRANPVSVIIS